MTYLEKLRVETNRMQVACISSRNKVKSLIAQYNLKSNHLSKEYKKIIRLMDEAKQTMNDYKKPLMSPCREPVFYETAIEDLIKCNAVLDKTIEDIEKKYNKHWYAHTGTATATGTTTFQSYVGAIYSWQPSGKSNYHVLFDRIAKDHLYGSLSSKEEPEKKKSIPKWTPPGSLKINSKSAPDYQSSRQL